MKEITSRICYICKKEKDIREFAKDKSQIGGYTYNCKECRNKQYNEYYKNNPDKAIIKNLKQKENRKRFYSSEKGIISSRRAHLKRMFNMTLEEYNQKLEEQNNQCAICKSYNIHDKHGVLAVDHCHKTNKVRGLLCFKCNTILGSVNDNKTILKNAIKYLQKYEI